jgi:hypothetical protein
MALESLDIQKAPKGQFRLTSTKVMKSKQSQKNLTPAARTGKLLRQSGEKLR